MVNFNPLAAEIGLVVWGTPANFYGLCVLAALLHSAQHSSSGRQPNFAILNRRCHLCLAGRPSRWALANISSCECLLVIVIWLIYDNIHAAREVMVHCVLSNPFVLSSYWCVYLSQTVIWMMKRKYVLVTFFCSIMWKYFGLCVDIKNIFFFGAFALSTLTLLIGYQEEHVACKSVCWHDYLSGVRCKLFAYGPADATCHPIVYCFIKIQNGFTFLVPTYPDCSGNEAVKRVSVCLLI